MLMKKEDDINKDDNYIKFKINDKTKKIFI